MFNDSFSVYDDNNKAFATPEQLAQLDEYTTIKCPLLLRYPKKTVSEAPLKEAIILDRLVGTIINNINPAKNQLDKHRELQESEQNN